MKNIPLARRHAPLTKRVHRRRRLHRPARRRQKLTCGPSPSRCRVRHAQPRARLPRLAPTRPSSGQRPQPPKCSPPQPSSPTAPAHGAASTTGRRRPPITVGMQQFLLLLHRALRPRAREVAAPWTTSPPRPRAYVGSRASKEITLLGQNVNSYGRDLYGEAPVRRRPSVPWTHAGIERLRFATSHPKDLTDEVIEKFGSLRSLMPALHLPVQSGSNRHSRSNEQALFARPLPRASSARFADVRPDIALSTDIIVGLPR